MSGSAPNGRKTRSPLGSEHPSRGILNKLADVTNVQIVQPRSRKPVLCDLANVSTLSGVVARFHTHIEDYHTALAYPHTSLTWHVSPIFHKSLPISHSCILLTFQGLSLMAIGLVLREQACAARWCNASQGDSAFTFGKLFRHPHHVATNGSGFLQRR